MRRLTVGLLLASFAAAQEKLEVEAPSPSTIRLGDTARANIRIEGREANPRTPVLPDVPGMRLQLTPPSRTSQSFFDGRTLTEHTGVQYQLLLQPLQEGTYTVPPFAIWTGTREQMTPELRLEVKKDLRGEELAWLDVKVEPRRVYVHEPVRIRVDFGIEPGLRLVQDRLNNGQPYSDAEVQAPWLIDFPGGEPIEQPRPAGDLCIVVLQRTPVLAARETNYEHGGARWNRYSFERSFLPTRIGTIELTAPMLRYQVLLREGQRDIFGGRRGAQAENYYVYGKPITLEVLPIPEAGRPVPYYGAVGRFTLDARLDKDTVKVGNSVKLLLTVRGQGNFEFLRLPELGDLEGFHKLGATEARDADKVVVTYDLTPLSTDVKEVPAIGWNYFDTTPGVESFVAVKTPPLPLVVKPLENGETLAPLPDASVAAVTPGVDDVFDLPSFDGAPARRSQLATWWVWLAVLAPWLLAGLVAFVRAGMRRRAADPLAQTARAAGRTCLRALQDGGEPTEALAGSVGDRLGVPAAAVIAPDLVLRLTEAGLEPAAANEVAAAIDRGTAQRYGGGAVLDAATVRELVQRLEAVRFGVTARLLLLLLPLLGVFALGGELRAQSGGDVAAAVAAYRAGDYRAAATAFTGEYEATGDRRLLQASGNCFFRQGDLARALWAYESARLGRPRDAELLANIALVRQRLQLDDGGEGFVAELVALRDRLLPAERLLLCAFGMTFAALCLVFGWRRIGLRWIGVLVLVPTAVVALDLLWFAPQQPAHAIALQKLALVSEPRAGLEPVATVRPGVELSLLGGAQGTFVRVAAGDRIGYAPSDAVAIVQ